MTASTCGHSPGGMSSTSSGKCRCLSQHDHFILLLFSPFKLCLTSGTRQITLPPTLGMGEMVHQATSLLSSPSHACPDPDTHTRSLDLQHAACRPWLTTLEELQIGNVYHEWRLFVPETANKIKYHLEIFMLVRHDVAVLVTLSIVN